MKDAKKIIAGIIIGFVIASLFAIPLLSTAPARAASSQTWHYATLIASADPELYAVITGDDKKDTTLNEKIYNLKDPNLAKVLDVVGADGWELVSTVIIGTNLTECILKQSD
jgi:uncharacterized membrane protein